MAPNGSSRKTPATSKITNGHIKAEGRASVPLENLFDDLKDHGSPEAEMDLKKKSVAGVKKAGGWDSEGNPSAPTTARSSPAPTTGSLNKIPTTFTKAFANSKPLGDKAEIQKCTHCKRGVTKHSMAKHVETCLNKKQEKQRKKKEAKDARDAAARKEKNAANGVADSEDEDDEGPGKKTTSGASKTGLGGASSKKRKAGEGVDDTPDGGPAKKKSKKGANNAAAGDNTNSKSKSARPKAPVDVEKQCGVDLPQGGQCARSLTCKSHSMGAKRAVPGRSAPYDKLLMEYQRKNQAKLQKAQFDANAPNPEDEGLRDQGPVDSEEETEAVMSAISRFWGGKPLYQHVRVPLRAKYQHNRIRGMLQSAFGNRGAGSGGHLYSAGSSLSSGGGGGFFGSSAPAVTATSSASASASGTAAPVVDDNGIIHARRGSVVPGARSMMAPANRKASVASASSVANAGSTAAAVGA